MGVLSLSPLPAAPEYERGHILGGSATLPELAQYANRKFAEAAMAELTANDRRIEAGRALKLAKERVGKGWQKWCERHIQRSKADIYRCLALVDRATHAEQMAAREAEKAKAREGMRKVREGRTAALSQTLETLSGAPVGSVVLEPSAPIVVTPLPAAPRRALAEIELPTDTTKLRKAALAEIADLREAIACNDPAPKVGKILVSLNRAVAALLASGAGRV